MEKVYLVEDYNNDNSKICKSYGTALEYALQLVVDAWDCTEKYPNSDFKMAYRSLYDNIKSLKEDGYVEGICCIVIKYIED
jgi:uncharacterized protein YutE (UPF0331/DUF86 family)